MGELANEEFSNYDAGQHCGCKEYNLPCRGACGTKKAAEAAAKAIKDAAASIKSETNKVIDKLDQGVAWHYAQKVNPAMLAARGAFRSILELNLFSITKALSLVKDKNKKRWDELLQKWWMMGGEKGEFDKLIEKKKNRDPFGQKFADKFNKSGIDGGYSNAGGESAVKIIKGATLATSAAATILGSIPEPSGATKAAAGYVGIGSAVLQAMSGILKGAVADGGGDTTGMPDGKDIPPPTEQELADAAKLALEEEKKEKNKKILIYSGVGVAVLGLAIGAYFFFKTKK